MASQFSESNEEVEVRREDQDKICEFGRNQNKVNEIKDDIKELQKQLDDLDDAEQEVMLAEGDGDAFKVRIAESFLEVTEDRLNEFIEKEREGVESSIDSLKENLGKLNERQHTLKDALYSRFGKNINLEI